MSISCYSCYLVGSFPYLHPSRLYPPHLEYPPLDFEKSGAGKWPTSKKPSPSLRAGEPESGRPGNPTPLGSEPHGEPKGCKNVGKQSLWRLLSKNSGMDHFCFINHYGNECLRRAKRAGKFLLQPLIKPVVFGAKSHSRATFGLPDLSNDPHE